MAHPLVEQLRFTRAEWRRALRGVPETDGRRHVGPMNSIGWIVAHLAWQEQRYFVTRLAGVTPVPEINEAAMHRSLPGSPRRLAGNAIQRVIYHYWFHMGEILAIRQVLEHPNRPEFVGDIDERAPYRSCG